MIKYLWFESKEKEWGKYLLPPNPWKYFQKMENPIDKENFNLLKKVYKIVNTYHNKEKTPWFNEIKNIKILKTFAFWWYIFIWFLITFFLWDKIFKYWVSFLMDFF